MSSLQGGNAMSANCCDIPALPIPTGGVPYLPDEIILYGMDIAGKHTISVAIPPVASVVTTGPYNYQVALLQGPGPGLGPGGTLLYQGPQLALTDAANIAVFDKTTTPAPLPAAPGPSVPRLQIAVIYGYAYEGQCYRLDKPKLLVFLSVNGTPASGCGFDTITGYSMWRVSATQDTVLELVSNADYFAKIILEGNLPGKRAPNTYAANAKPMTSLSHRGGRLTET
jgi:hypothetical protein